MELINEIKSLMPFCETLTMLYVEDDDNIRESTKRLFNNLFPNIITANDGKEGLQRYRENHIDIIIADINMPKMNGIEMAKKIREEDNDILILFLSAHSDSDFLLDAIKLEADGFLIKPASLETSLPAIIKCIKKIKIKKEHAEFEQKLLDTNKYLEHEVEKKTKELKEKLYKDDLTGANSRFALYERLDKCENTPVLILVDINSFYIYNELYGTKLGNIILVEFTKILDKFAKNNGYDLFRVNADQFLFFATTEFVDIIKFEKDIDNIFKHIKEHKLFIKELESSVEITVTIGISFSPENPLAKVEMALNDAKKHNRLFAAYTTDIDTSEDSKNSLYWVKEIEAAVKEDRVLPYYQPIVDRERNTIKYEALIRLSQQDENGNKKIISPFHFVEIARKSNKYYELTNRMVRKVIDDMKDKNYDVSLNLSYTDMKFHEIQDTLKEKLSEYYDHKKKSGNNNSIVLEILEDEQVRDYEIMKNYLTSYKNIGAKIAIDDFGSGYSNFSHIIAISPNYLKIDGSIIENILKDNNSFQMVKAIVQFAKSLGIKTIAEYISSKELFDIAYDLGIEEFQGFYFGEPMPIDKIPD